MLKKKLTKVIKIMIIFKVKIKKKQYIFYQHYNNIKKWFD